MRDVSIFWHMLPLMPAAAGGAAKKLKGEEGDGGEEDGDEHYQKGRQ